MSCPEKRILCIGCICVDLVVTAEKYPEEDTLISGLRQRWQRGGNAGNDCTVLSYLQCQCECLTTFVSEPEGEDAHYTHHVPICRNLPEVTFQDFQKLDLGNYKWIHFEARYSEEYAQMMKSIHEWNLKKSPSEKITISLEIELLDTECTSMMAFADFVFVNKELAKMHGLITKEEAIAKFWLPCKDGSTVIIPWGNEGAIARSQNGDIIEAPAFHPVSVVDTLGAGDTFVSSIIFALSNGHDLSKAIHFGCKLAGTKCGLEGFFELKSIALQLYHEMFSV